MLLKFNQLHINDVENLQKISISTFREAFAKDNTEENLLAYFKKAFAIEELQKQIQNSLSFFYFLRVEEEIIGYFKVNIGESQTELHDPKGMELERIYLLHAHQGKGFGQLVLNKVKDLAKQMQKTFIWLGVWEHNKNAIRFYQKNGFMKFDTHIYPVGNDPQIDWMMRLEIV